MEFDGAGVGVGEMEAGEGGQRVFSDLGIQGLVRSGFALPVHGTSAQR